MKNDVDNAWRLREPFFRSRGLSIDDFLGFLGIDRSRLECIDLFGIEGLEALSVRGIKGRVGEAYPEHFHYDYHLTCGVNGSSRVISGNGGNYLVAAINALFTYFEFYEKVRQKS